MKRKLTLILLISALFLSSCSGGQTAAETSAASASETAVSAEEPSVSSSEETEEITDSEQTETEINEVHKAELVPLGDLKEIAIPDYKFNNMSTVCNGKVLAVSEPSLSMETGIITVEAAMINLDDYSYILKTLELDYMTEINRDEEYIWCDITPYIINGSPVLFETDNGSLWLLDDELDVIESSADMIAGDYFSVNNRSVSPSGTAYMNSISWDEETENVYYSLTVKDGHLLTEKVEFPIYGDEYITYINIFNDDEFLLLTSNDKTYENGTYIFNRKTDELTRIASPDSQNSYYEYSALGGKLIRKEYATGYLSIDVFSPDKPNFKVNPKFIGSNFISVTTSSFSDNIYVAETVSEADENEDVYYSDVLHLISAETGNTLAAVKTTKSLFGVSFSFADDYDGKVILSAFIDGANKLILWEPEISEEVYSWNSVSDNTTDEIKSIVSEIKERYDINVYYGDDAVRYFSAYAVLSENRPECILNALNTLKSIFDSMPEGFIAEIRQTSPINIYLTGTIRPNTDSESSISDCAGFVECDSSNAELMVVDISGYSSKENIDLTMPHEFFHIIEDTINTKAYYENYSVNNERFYLWSVINPMDFQYMFSYGYDYNNSDLYRQYITEWGKTNDDAFFFDNYSMTYPNEDRARFFEKFMYKVLGDNSVSPSSLEGEGIQLKMRYLCLCLRDCFDSLKNCDDIVWEECVTLDRDLEWYRENYELDEWLVEEALG